MKKIINILIIVFFIMLSKSMALENKILFKIDNEIITTVDVFKEIMSLKFFNKNLNQLKNEENYQIAIQSIIKNKIKENEVLKNFNEIKLLNEDYLNQIIKKTYNDLGFKNLQDFKDALSKNEINFKNYKKKLMVDILWNQIIYSKYYDKIIINEEKLKKIIKNKNNKVNSLYLKEIVFQVSDVSEIDAKYNLIKNDIEELGFESAALKYSISNSSNNGGDLGWIDEKSINKEILKEIKKISVKSITKPIRISSGFIILQKFDEREIQKNFNGEEELSKIID